VADVSNMPADILIIDDDENVRYSIRTTLAQRGHAIHECQDATHARERLAAHEFDLVLCDINLGDEDGIDLVRDARRAGYAGPIVMITAYASIESAVEAMKAGADDYLQKPLRLDELELLVDRLLQHGSLRRRLRLYERLDGVRGKRAGIVGDSDPWKKAIAAAERLAALPLRSPRGGAEGETPGGALPTILLLGETGTGKGILARHIHRCAADAEDADAPPPLVEVNCTALPPTLVEAELFGHEKGAFTDARDAREGLFEMADGGVIFLDEIGDMPLDLQAKLLTVIESGSFRRVGGTKTHSIRARLIAATNRDLEAKVADGSFRRDLYYRLNTFTIEIPPLRERGHDALQIAESALERFAEEFGRPGLRLSPDASQAILEHDWPGNVREVVNVVQRAALLAEHEVIGPEDLGLSRLDAPGGSGDEAGGLARAHFDFERARYTADSVERDLLLAALRHARGNVTQAARLIGLQRSTFRYRLERQNLDDVAREMNGK